MGGIQMGNKVFILVPLEDLHIDESYQRPVQNHIKTLVQEWDEQKCDLLKVNYREDGNLYVWDNIYVYSALYMCWNVFYISTRKREVVIYNDWRKSIMAFVLQKDNYFCYLDGKHAVCKTQNINLATRFDTQGNACAMLNKASKKLKDYKIVDLENMQVAGDIHKIKRKQFSQTERIKIYNKSKGRCAICGKFIPYDSFTVDHIVPLAKGGTNEMNNLQAACGVYNLIKQDILPEDLMKKLTEIILYQMRKSYDDKLWRKINCLRRLEQKRKIRSVIDTLIKMK